MCASTLPQLLDLDAELRVARLRLLLDPLEPPLDVVAVGDEQLEPQVLEIAGRVGAGREAVEDDEQRVDLAQVPEQRRPRAGHVLDADRGRRDLLRAGRPRASASSRSSAICAMPTFVLPYSPPPAFVSAVKSVVFPAPGRPTIPTSSATRLSCWRRSRRGSRARSAS